MKSFTFHEFMYKEMQNIKSLSQRAVAYDSLFKFALYGVKDENFGVFYDFVVQDEAFRMWMNRVHGQRIRRKEERARDVQSKH